MAVERLDDGTYRVGSMTFTTAEKAFDFDSQQRSTAAPPLPRERLGAPGAQASQWKRMSPASRAGAIAATAALVIVVAAAIANSNKPAAKQAAAAPSPAVQTVAPPATAPVAAAPAKPLAPLVVTPTSAWDYSSKTDQMTGKRSSEATVVSDNSIKLDFPYNGDQKGFLVVRRHPQYGLDVIVAVQKGQILCNTYDCKISIKFDDAPPTKWGGTEPADHSSTSVFIDGPERFINVAKKSKKILVQLNFFHNGSQVLEFSSPVPLEWPPK